MNGKTRMETEGPELEISIAWWGDENRNEYMQELLGIYEQQNPGISFRPVPLGAEDYEEYLAVTAAAGESPDIMQMNGKLLTVYERNHTLADWQAAAGEGIQKELPIDTALMDTGKRGGIQAGIPVSVSIPVMVYRPCILQEAGVELPERLDWKSFSQLCGAVSRETDGPGLVYDHSSCDLLLTWMEQRENRFSGKGNRCLRQREKRIFWIISFFVRKCLQTERWRLQRQGKRWKGRVPFSLGDRSFFHLSRKLM